MSTLRVNRIEPRTGDSVEIVGFEAPEAPTTPVKAWVNFNAVGTVEIRDSMNVSSITDEAVGVFTVNFATPFPDTNYICVAAQSPGGSEVHGARSNVNIVIPDANEKTISSQPIDCRYVHGYNDPLTVHVVIIGN